MWLVEFGSILVTMTHSEPLARRLSIALCVCVHVCMCECYNREWYVSQSGFS